MNGWVVFGSGLLAGSVVAAVLLKMSDLPQRGAALQASLVEGGDDLRTAFFAQREEIENELSEVGRREAERLARGHAEFLVKQRMDSFGLTPTRARKLEALYERWS